MQKFLILLFPVLIFSCSYSAELNRYSVPEKIIIEEMSQFYYVAPQCYDMDEALVLYPGGLVEPDAYIPLAADLSKHYGMAVFIGKMPFNLAVFGKTRIEKILQEYNYIGRWYMAGHSLGGVMASSWIDGNPGIVEKLILLASYPGKNDSLAEDDIDVLSLRGSLDGLVARERILETSSLLPQSTVYREIEGGNHGQFGSYGEQKGDNKALISEEEQRSLTVEYISVFLGD